MARKVGVEFALTLYHVLDRGDRQQDIFRDDADRNHFLKTLGEACTRTGWRVHALVLMSLNGLALLFFVLLYAPFALADLLKRLRPA